MTELTLDTFLPKSGAFPQLWPTDKKSSLTLSDLIAPRPASGVQTKPRPGNVLRTVDDYVRQIAEGASFGLADPFAAWVNRRLGIQEGSTVESQRARTSAFENENPLTSLAAQLGGGIATSLPGAARIMALKLPTFVKLSLLGAAGGAASGVGHSDTLADVPGNIAGGGAVGALAGPIIGTAGNLAIKAVSPLVRGIVNKFGTGALSGEARKLAEAFQRDFPDKSPEEIVTMAQGALARLGPRGALTDVGGKNVQMLSEAVANRPGVPAQQASQFLEGRIAEQPGAIKRATVIATDNLREFGPAKNFFQTQQALEKQAAETAAPLYKEAFAANKQVESDTIDRILETDVGKEALRSAARRMNTRMSLMSKSDPALTEQKNEAVLLGKMVESGQVGKGLKLETLNLVKQEIDDMWLTAKRAAERGTGRAGEARDLNDIRRKFVSALDEADATASAGPNSTKVEGGAYARARAAWAGPAESQDAMEMGMKFLKQPAEVTKQDISNLSPGNKEFFKIGVRTTLDDVVGGTPDEAGAVRRIFGNQNLRDKLSAAFDNPEAYTEFAREMAAQKQFVKSRNEVLKNSSTARRQAAQEDLPSDTAPLMDLAQGNVGSAAMKMGNKLYSKLTGPSEEELNKLGPMLFDPARAADALDQMATRASLYSPLRTLGGPVSGALAAQVGAQTHDTPMLGTARADEPPPGFKRPELYVSMVPGVGGYREAPNPFSSLYDER